MFRYKISDGLYEEKYVLSKGGVLANDLYACYLTDSVSFREYVGRYDAKEKYVFIKIEKDSVKAVKYSRRIHYGKYIAIDSSFYSISLLRKTGNFD